MKEKRIIAIDTDPGIDDALAIMLAASCPEIEISAILPVNGNVSLEYTTRDALQIKKLLGLHSRIGIGAEKPLKALNRCHTAAIHGGGMAGCSIETDEVPENKACQDILMEEASEWAGRLDLIALAPLTNVAEALIQYPVLKQKIRSIMIMGGSAAEGNITPFAEFNSWTDPEACDIVLRSGIPIRICGLDGLQSAALNDAEMQEFMGYGGKIGSIAGQMISFLKDHSHGWGEHSGVVIYDLVTMACYLHPEIGKFRPALIRCVTGDVPEAGKTVVEYTDNTGKQPNAEILVSCNKEAYKALFKEALQKLSLR